MYKSVLCHLHSIFEGNASSMSGFCYEANRFGIDAVWITDHDKRFFRDKSHLLNFSDDYRLGTVNGPDFFKAEKGDRGSLRFSTASAGGRWAGGVATLPFAGKPHGFPLVGRPILSLGFKSDIKSWETDRRLFLHFRLGQVPPEHKPLIVTYYLGAPPEQEHILPLPAGANSAEISLADDMEKLGVGLDHNLNRIELGIEARNGAKAAVELESISVETELFSADDLLSAQRNLGSQLGEKFGVNVFVNLEISCVFESDNGDINAFGDSVPVRPADRDRMPAKEAVLFIERNGGVACLNHPLRVRGWKDMDLNEEVKADIINMRAEEFIRNDLYGARILEVAYPEGRNGFSAAHHARLWDRLNMNGLRVAAIGVSDAHSNRPWGDGNNFANYVRSPDCRAENLIAAMKKGDVYTADPARVGGRLRFETDEGRTMGDIQSNGEAHFEIHDIPFGSRLAWVIDGKYLSGELTSDSHTSRIALAGAKRFVRAELYDTYGRLLLMTNPIWTS